MGVVSDVDAAKGNQEADYIRLPDGTLLDERIQCTGGGTYNYVTDGQGSTVAVTNSAGQQVNGYQYDPYGNVVSSLASVANPWRYASGYQDDQTGLYKYGARYYNPNDGQWTQPDPSGQDPNPYTYTSGNPASDIDPSGLSKCGDFSGGGLVDCVSKGGHEAFRVAKHYAGSCFKGGTEGAIVGAIGGALAGEGVGAAPGAAGGFALGCIQGAGSQSEREHGRSDLADLLDWLGDLSDLANPG